MPREPMPREPILLPCGSLLPKPGMDLQIIPRLECSARLQLSLS